MDNDELLATVEREEANCIVHYTSLLSEQRRKAMQYYYGQPYGNEVEGRSQVVTTEVKDAVEGILPPLMAIFTASDEIVRFEPQNPDDEAVAQQATDYVNYIFSRLNNGFLALYCLFKDALLQKNGYVKVYWENYEDQAKETYENLTDMEFQSLTSDDELELLEHTEKPDPVGAQQQLQQRGIQQQIPQLPPPQLHDAVFRRSRKHGKVCIDPLPPEEVLISREAPNELTKARFVEHRTLRTLSDIREMGYKISDDIADYAPKADFNLERVERLKFDDALAYRQDADSNDPSTKRVWLCEAYLKVDFDGDGIAELRKVTKVGKTLLDNEEFDSLPIIGGTAILMPHKHYGLSIYDLVGDLQLQKSTVLRQLFDNAYVANNGRMEVLENMVNMADLLTARPNGVVRVKAMGSLKRIENPLLGQPFYNLLDYLDKVKINRVGARDFGDAVDPNALNAKAHTAELVSNSAQERINLMARILAEGPVKEIFWKILELISKHEDKPRMVKLEGKWIQVDPREWRNKFNMTVTVGLGTGSQQTTLNGVNMLAQLYSGAFQVGLGGRVITEQNAYHLIHKAAKAVFPKDADALVTDPSTIPPAQPKPDPEMLKIQLAAHKAELNDQQKKDKLAVESQLEHMRQQLEAGKIQFQALTDKAQQDRDHQAEVMKLIVEHEQENRSRIADALAQVAVAKAQGATDQQQTVLGGIVDSLRAQQDHQHQVVQDLIKAHTQAALAPKEIVRGKDGKATGVRPVK
jgi:hypothetical protein